MCEKTKAPFKENVLLFSSEYGTSATHMNQEVTANDNKMTTGFVLSRDTKSKPKNRFVLVRAPHISGHKCGWEQKI